MVAAAVEVVVKRTQPQEDARVAHSSPRRAPPTTLRPLKARTMYPRRRSSDGLPTSSRRGLPRGPRCGGRQRGRLCRARSPRASPRAAMARGRVIQRGRGCRVQPRRAPKSSRGAVRSALQASAPTLLRSAPCTHHRGHSKVAALFPEVPWSFPPSRMASGRVGMPTAGSRAG